MSKCGMNFAAVQHAPDTVYAYPVNENTLRLRIKTAKGDCTRICVRYKNTYDHVSSPSRQKMQLISTDKYNDYYEADITEPGKRFKYYFELTDQSGTVWNYSNYGFAPYNENYNKFFIYPYLFEEDLPGAPDWARQGLIYQIFIDRFNNGDPSNDPDNCVEWDAIPDRKSFYGGDFKGIMDKLDYIASLGATILYLSPIFLSKTNHKYDIIDYYIIDPAFGTVEEARELVKKAHFLGIRVVLDAVFNHCSNKNPLFLDVVSKGTKSKYFDWFSIRGENVETDPLNYDTFAGMVPEMPRLNTSNPHVQDYCIDVAVYWTKQLDIDGWRLDASDEVSHTFWKKFRSRIREVKRDIFILGEVWYRSTPWLLGDEFDSVTNYMFRNAILAMATDPQRSNTEFWDEVCANEMNYRSTTIPFLVNLVGSHDVKRILTALGGNRSMLFPVFGVLITYIGIPLIYYGDEVGIEGGEDPDNRRTMKWDAKNQDTKLLEFMRSLGMLRKNTNSIKNGSVKLLRNLPDRIVGFERIISPSVPIDNICSAEPEDRIILANFSRKNIRTDLILNVDGNGAEKRLYSCLDDRSFAVGDNGCSRIELDGYDFIVLKVR